MPAWRAGVVLVLLLILVLDLVRSGRAEVFRDENENENEQEKEVSGPAFARTSRFGGASTAELITREDAERIRATFGDWADDVPFEQPFAAAFDGGRAVSVCASVRVTDTARAAGV